MTNPTAGPLAVAVTVAGPAAEWAVVVPPALTVAPGESGRARVTFTVPDCERLAGSTRAFAVHVTGGTSAALGGCIEVPEVRDRRVSIHPLLARGRGPTAHTLTVENRGTGTARGALTSVGDLRLRLGVERVSVAPGEQATVGVTATPSGRPGPRVFTVEARPETGPTVTARATRFQDPLRWRRGALAAGMVLVAALTGALVIRVSGTPVAHVAATPVTPPTLASNCPAAGPADPHRLDIAGSAYCPATRAVAAGTELSWSNADLAPHTVTYDGPDGPVDSGSMAQGRSWSTRFDHAGTYAYYCRFHPGKRRCRTKVCSLPYPSPSL